MRHGNGDPHSKRRGADRRLRANQKAILRRSRVELDDGTTIWGIGDFDEEDTYGTVVYSRRTKQFLGGGN